MKMLESSRNKRLNEPGALPLYEAIYSVLRDHIVDAVFPPGLVLGETGVARAFSASRVPAAAALKRLHREGLVRAFQGRGYVIGGHAVKPVRLELFRAGLRLPAGLAQEFRSRKRHELIYPKVEHDVAACLSYGRFLLNESALAEHHGVSRTVAHEVLTKLERTGLVSRDSNQRWYAGPLTEELLREHFEMRWLLEPIALSQVAPEIDKAELDAKSRRAEEARDGKRLPTTLESLEHDLHVDLVLRCPNQQLRETIRRSQLPIIATHSTFEQHQSREEISTMIAEHLEIFHCLSSGRHKKAIAALEGHLRRSLGSNIVLLQRLRTPPPDFLPPYLVPVQA
ncbi:GntR family transcriptional regulator [Mesorhizobium sp. BAC0120]|uniref:GntR family transcriptional regulator n=1 Tax=Mesorhizobium sp. BAC0120 TaxID=3090670 RepID=UPI00298CD44F|nr:GntR family transcriptional regulator [Mesorhizobium sp. BAC0120]MDW6024874.1 GntR family transcriptional regulator [Mesorhizobium sp. BAC0120]